MRGTDHGMGRLARPPLTAPPRISQGERQGTGTYRKLAEGAQRTGQEYVRYGNAWIRIDPEQATQYLGTLVQLGPYDEDNSGRFQIEPNATEGRITAMSWKRRFWLAVGDPESYLQWAGQSN